MVNDKTRGEIRGKVTASDHNDDDVHGCLMARFYQEIRQSTLCSAHGPITSLKHIYLRLREPKLAGHQRSKLLLTLATGLVKNLWQAIAHVRITPSPMVLAFSGWEKRGASC